MRPSLWATWQPRGALGTLGIAKLMVVTYVRGPVCWQIWAVLLANVFCGVLWCFAGVL